MCSNANPESRASRLSGSTRRFLDATYDIRYLEYRVRRMNGFMETKQYTELPVEIRHALGKQKWLMEQTIDVLVERTCKLK